MAQKPNLTPVGKHEPDRREDERLELEKRARFGSGFDRSRESLSAPTAEHQVREGLSFWQAVKRMGK